MLCYHLSVICTLQSFLTELCYLANLTNDAFTQVLFAFVGFGCWYLSMLMISFCVSIVSFKRFLKLITGHCDLMSKFSD